MECIDQARAALEKAETQHCTNFDKGAVFHWAERGAYVLKADAEATIARLTAELDNERQHHVNTESLWNVDRGLIEVLRRELAEARASAAAAYEKAAQKAEYHMYMLSIGSPDEGPFTLQDRTCKEMREQAARAIRTLATEAETTALAEIVKRAVEDETYACAEVANCCYESGRRENTEHAILARLDQRKEAGK